MEALWIALAALTCAGAALGNWLFSRDRSPGDPRLDPLVKLARFRAFALAGAALFALVVLVIEVT